MTRTITAGDHRRVLLGGRSIEGQHLVGEPREQLGCGGLQTVSTVAIR
jgi:hypothetical protein